MRDSKGRFIKGCKPGPGRPRKKAIQLEQAPLWSYELLRQAWQVFKTANAYSILDILKCSKCGNDDASAFDYEPDQGGARLRCRCKKCGKWNDFRQHHMRFIKALPYPLSPEDRARVAIQRQAH